MRRQLQGESGHVRSKSGDEGFQRYFHVVEYKKMGGQSITANLFSPQQLVYITSAPPL